MSEEIPYIARCGWCEQGLVRLYRCDECDVVSAICDECERIWSDPAEVHVDPRTKSNGAHPNCPSCRNGDVTWTVLNEEEIDEDGFREFVAGNST